MKKILPIVLALVLMLACLVGCGPVGKSLDEIKAAGKLVVATSPDFPPFENLENGKVVGIEIELLEKICAQLGVELVIEQMAFDSVLPGVQTGKFDMGVSGISVTPDREANALFTIPYCLAAQAIVVLEGSDITSKADLAGKSVAVQTATTAEEFCRENGYNVLSYEANSDAQLALLGGRVQAWVIDDLTAAEMVAAHNEANPDQKLVILDEAMTTEPYAFAMAFGSEDVIEAINPILQGLIEDGTVAALFEKYNAPYTMPQGDEK